MTNGLNTSRAYTGLILSSVWVAGPGAGISLESTLGGEGGQSRLGPRRMLALENTASALGWTPRDPYSVGWSL